MFPKGTRMEVSFFHKISFTGQAAGSSFPFGFGWEPGISPSRKGVSLVVTNMCHRLTGIYFPQSRKGKILPRSFFFQPVQRAVPSPFIHRGPAVVQPELRTLVATIFHKLQVLSICNQTIAQLKGFQQFTMPRMLVVVGEFIALITYLVNAFLERNPV